MILSQRQELLREFVIKAHGDQKRKYSDEPYIVHLDFVASMVVPFIPKYPLIWEVAICHDLFEDTLAAQIINEELIRIGYIDEEMFIIVSGIYDLTDVFTKETCPHLNREGRKRNESNRLGRTCPSSQTTKYADLIHNTESIVENDPKFAVTYLQEKAMYLQKMRNGEWDLYEKAVWTLHESKLKLGLWR